VIESRSLHLGRCDSLVLSGLRSLRSDTDFPSFVNHPVLNRQDHLINSADHDRLLELELRAGLHS
jgi:hypothetical protein